VVTPVGVEKAGKDDLGWRNAATEQVAIWLMNGTGPIGSANSRAEKSSGRTDSRRAARDAAIP